MAGKFEIYKDGKGEYRFRLKARNGEIVASGESYPSKAVAKKGIAAVQRAAKDATIEDLTRHSERRLSYECRGVPPKVERGGRPRHSHGSTPCVVR